MRGPRGYFDLFQLLIKNSRYQQKQYASPAQLIEGHFAFWSTPNHVNRNIFRLTLNELQGRPAKIIETGTSAWGTDSTRLWDSYIRNVGGSFVSIDIRKAASSRLKWQTSSRTSFQICDSVEFLAKKKYEPADLYFLDSWDLDLSDPLPSAEHGLKEFLAIKPLLIPGNLLLIDDTPSETFLVDYKNLPPNSLTFIEKYKVLPGKGAFIPQALARDFEFEILAHEYAILLRILGKKNAT